MYRLILASFSRQVIPLSALCAFLLFTAPAVAISFDALVTGVTVDPQDTDRIYASTVGGLLRTDNRGATWQQLPIYPLGSRQPSLRRIEFDMGNTATIYAAAPGQLGGPLVGAWRSVDRGSNWQRIIKEDTFPEGSELVRLLVAPTDGSVIYAVVERASVDSTYRSGDGGATWVKGGTGGAHAVSSGNADTLYRGSRGRVYRSTNGAQGWTQIGQTVNLNDLELNGINGIAVSPTDPDVLLATVNGPYSSPNGIYRSTSGGSSWTRVLHSNVIGVYFHPTNGSQAIVGDCCGISTYYSSDGGQNFSDVGREVPGFPDNFGGSVSRTFFDLAQPGRLIQGMGTPQGGGVAVAIAPNGAWNKLPGEYTPTAVPDTYLDSGKLLKGDTSQARTTVRIVAAEGGSASFTIGQPSIAGAGLSVSIHEDGTDPEEPTPRFTVIRDAEDLAVGTHQAQLTVPVTGAANGQVNIEGLLEVVDTPESPGVYLGRGLPAGNSASVYSLSSTGGGILIGSFARIYALDGAGNLELVAGTGTSGFSGDGGLATNAQVGFVRAIVEAPDGTIYFHDSSGRRIRRIAADGKISTFAGDPSQGTTISDGAKLDDVSFSVTPGLAVRSNGELLLAHSSRIWRVDGDEFRLVAGGGITSPSTGVDSDEANLSGVDAVQIDGQGRIVFALSAQLFRIESSGKLKHLAGARVTEAVPGSSKATEADLSIDAFALRDDRIFIADRDSLRILRVDPDGTIVPVGFNGMSGTPSSCTGAAYAPISSTVVSGLVLGPDGSLFVGVTGLPRFWLPTAGGPAGPAPAVTPEGVVNAASFERKLSPGALASVFGTNLSVSEAAASALPLPAELNGTVICLAGQAAPLIFTSPLQANGQLPFGLQPGTHALRAFNGNGGTASVPVEVQEASPGVFRANGRAVVINPDGSLNAPGNGVAAGEAVVAYLTGIGDVTPEVIAGWANPGDPLAVPNVATSATVGGAAAELYYLGMTPGFAGLAQANIKIPALPPGEHMFVLTVGGNASEALVLTVK